jgi:hypothetical protein
MGGATAGNGDAAAQLRDSHHLPDHGWITAEQIGPGMIRHDREARRVAAGDGVLLMRERAPERRRHAKRVEETLGDSSNQHLERRAIVAEVGSIERLIRVSADGSDH